MLKEKAIELFNISKEKEDLKIISNEKIESLRQQGDIIVQDYRIKLDAIVLKEAEVSNKLSSLLQQLTPQEIVFENEEKHYIAYYDRKFMVTRVKQVMTAKEADIHLSVKTMLESK